MVFDHALVASGDEDEVFDAGLAGLIDHVLNERPVDHRQHFLRHRLGRRQEPGAEPGDGEDGFANEFHESPLVEEGEAEYRRMQDAFLPESTFKSLSTDRPRLAGR